MTFSNDAAETHSSRPDAPTLPEGTQGTVTLDELFFILSRGALGSAPYCESPECMVKAPLHKCGFCGLSFCEKHCDYQTTWYDDMPAHICYDCLRGEVDYLS